MPIASHISQLFQLAREHGWSNDFIEQFIRNDSCFDYDIDISQVPALPSISELFPSTKYPDRIFPRTLLRVMFSPLNVPLRL